MSEPFSVEHFVEWAGALTLDNGEPWVVEDWQLRPIQDLFAGVREVWEVIPEGNAKTTKAAGIALYYLEHTPMASIPIAAASREQAEILYRQAEGFVIRSERMHAKVPDVIGAAKGKRRSDVPRFECQEGYRRIKHFEGSRLQIYAADDRTGDGVIPTFAIVDELHRHRDLRLYRTWRGKLDKRGGQVLAISTAGEPETEFESTRDRLRQEARAVERVGAYVRAESDRVVLHEYMLEDGCQPDDFEAVKRANPLSTITVEGLRAKYNDPTQDLNDWMRLVCNRPTRAHETAITETEWDDIGTDVDIPAGASVDVGLDVAFKWDTTAAVPLYRHPEFRLLGAAKILIPPRDGSSMHPDVIKQAILDLASDYRVDTVIMDMERAADIAAWLEDELGVTVIDRSQTNKMACEDYEAMMDGIRNKTVRHTRDRGLRAHVLNAVARRLPGGDRRFDRASSVRQNVGAQDRRVIDALTAAGMVVEHSTRDTPVASIYEEQYAA